MLEHGSIIAINDGIALISLEPSDACGECPAHTYCRPRGGKRVLEAIDTHGYQVGDNVTIEIAPKTGLLAALLFFGLPVILGLVAMLIALRYGELATVVCGIGAFMLGLLMAKIINDFLASKRALLPRILHKQESNKS